MIQRPVLFLAPAVAILSLMLVLTFQDSAAAVTPAVPDAIASPAPIAAQPLEQRAPVRIEPETFEIAPAPTRPPTAVMTASFVAVATPAPVVAPASVAPAPATPVSSAIGPSRLSVPSLGINSGWGNTGCEDQNSLPLGVFRWTCSGANNTYLVSHNTSTFASLRQAYVAGSLRAGMIAYFSDAAGNVSTWRLAWATDMEKTSEVYNRWAEVGGSSSTPVLTMQTCLDGGVGGADSTRFIIAKWVPAG